MSNQQNDIFYEALEEAEYDPTPAGSTAEDFIPTENTWFEKDGTMVIETENKTYRI